MMEANDNRIVLVVDDSMLICKQIISALKDRGPLVYEAHNGDEALEMVRQYQPDLILLDVVLPDTDRATSCSTSSRRRDRRTR